MPSFGACAWSKQDDGIAVGKGLFSRIADMGHGWHQHQLVTGKRSTGADKVHIQPATPHRFVPAEHQFVVFEVFPLRLDMRDPVRLIVIDNGHRGLLCRGQGTKFFNLRPALQRFLAAG